MKIILYGLLFLAILFIIARITVFFKKGKEITVDQFKSMWEKQKIDLLLDVRTEPEFRIDPGHIKGAMNIVDRYIHENPGCMEKFREKKIAVICRTDRRSSAVAGLLTAKGFPDVFIVKGGILAWKGKGYPIEFGK